MTTASRTAPTQDADGPAREVFAFDRFRVNVATCECWRDGERLAVAGKAFDALVVLLRNRDRVVSKEELMKAVWLDAFVSDDSLTQVIRALRRSLGDHATHPIYVSTIPGRGYRFVGEVRVLAPHAEPAHSTADHTSLEVPTPPSSTNVVVARPDPEALSQPRRPLVFVASIILASIGLLSLGYSLWLPVRPVGLNGAGLPLHLSVEVSTGVALESGPVLSPDGTRITFVASSVSDNRARLWIRDLVTGEARLLEGTEDPSRPFWSPDGKEIAFFESGALHVIPAAGGKSRQLLQGRNTGGGSWGTTALLISEGRSPVYSVSLSGHMKTAVTALDASTQEVSHRWPQWLPDQQHFLYYIESANPERSGTYLGSLDGLKRRLLDSPAIHTPGHLIFVRRRVLFAQRFDDASMQPLGEPVALASDVTAPEATTGAAISVSGNTIAYGGGPATERFVWFDRAGRQLSTVEAPPGLYNPKLTFDEKALLAASGSQNGSRGIWRIDLNRGEQTRLTEGMRPLASPDGSQIVFTTDRARGVSDIYIRTLGGGDRDDLLVASAENKVVNDWSADGGSVVFASISPRTKWDLWRLPLAGDRKAQSLMTTPFNEIQGQLSQSGRWIAYSSDETGTYEVYLQAFPGGGNKRSVSVGGGTEPHWRRDEREVFYLAPDRSLMAVAVSPGAVPQLGTPTRLFRLPVITRDRLNVAHYDVSSDGERFLVHTHVAGEQADSIKVLVNWTTTMVQ